MIQKIYNLFQKKSTVVVHDGSFHADEIFGVAVMDIYLKGNLQVTRTRDEEIIEAADYVLDVGGEYDPEMNRYDHHQTEGAGTRDNGIPYATAGLIWKHFGKKIIKNEDLWRIIDQKIVQPIDANDNGLDLYELKYSGVYPYSLQSIVNTRRPTWREENEINLDKEFFSLVEFFKDILKRELEIGRDFLISKKEINKAVELAEDEHIIVLDQNYPFDEALQEYPSVYFVVSPRNDGTWRIAGVRNNLNTFDSLRKKLPNTWGGLRGDMLKKITGEQTARFCHRALFLCVADTKEGAIRLAKKALES